MQFIAYYRVSTQKQGRSGLGLDAQTSAVQDYVSRSGGELVASHTEIESGKKTNRVELQAALAACKAQGATLIVAKLDRLGRNMAFVSALMESGVEFVCCDNPHANKLTIHILAAVAEYEREQISQRTKAALHAARLRGQRLGSPRPHAGSRIANAKQAAKADAFAARVKLIVDDLAAVGVTSLSAIASALNARGISTARGGTWHATTVRNVLARAA